MSGRRPLASVDETTTPWRMLPGGDPEASRGFRQAVEDPARCRIRHGMVGRAEPAREEGQGIRHAAAVVDRGPDVLGLGPGDPRPGWRPWPCRRGTSGAGHEPASCPVPLARPQGRRSSPRQDGLVQPDGIRPDDHGDRPHPPRQRATRFPGRWPPARHGLGAGGRCWRGRLTRRLPERPRRAVARTQPSRPRRSGRRAGCSSRDPAPQADLRRPQPRCR